MEELETEGIKTVYSSQIGARIGASAHSVRKDMGLLGDIGNNLAGYDVSKLKRHIHKTLGFDKIRNACIVGLGKLGTAILHYTRFMGNTFRIVAGFDNDINTLEIIEASVDVFPAYRMEEIIAGRKIEIAILAVPKSAAQTTAERLLACGIRGIVNFAPVVIRTDDKNVFIRNMDLITEMRILSSLISFDANTETPEISL